MASIAFDKIIDKVFDGFKRITPALIATALFSGAILFLPESVLQKMNLRNLSPTVRTILGALFLLSCTLVLTILCTTILQKISHRYQQWKYKQRLRKQLLDLSPQHKKMLKQLLNTQGRSIQWSGKNGDVLFLQTSGMIHVPTQQIDVLDAMESLYTYVPQAWVIELYKEEPQILENTKNNSTKKKL